MKMKSQTLKFLIALLGIPFLMTVQSNAFAAEKKPAAVVAGPNCSKEKADFKKLYIELQKSLNYEGKDAYLDAKNQVALKNHTKDAPYEGKVFEEALFKEYQNSLRKVALMYQAAKFDSAAPAEFTSNPALVDFIKAIDGNDGSKYISANNVNTVIDGLQKASNAKYPADSKFRINDNDKYLLKKLLTHAQDRLCSIEKYEQTGKRDRNFTADELEKKKNAPLNQLILAVKDAKITKDSNIELENIVDEKVAINSAIAANIHALTEWAKNNKSCIPAIKTAGFMSSIQAGIQQCNYRKFVDALSDENVTNIESILHFINSNEKFLKGSQAKAETAMDEFKLQAYVDRTLKNLGNKINCSQVTNSSTNGKRLFVRNLPYNDATNKFDTSKISCKIKSKVSKKTPIPVEKALTEQECSQKIDLISDELGRGLEVKQKNTKEAVISFSIKDNPDCSDIDLASPVLTQQLVVKPFDVITPAIPGTEVITDKPTIPPVDTNPTITPVVGTTPPIMTQAICLANPTKARVGYVWEWDTVKKGDCAEVQKDNTCKTDILDLKVWNEEHKACEITLESCNTIPGTDTASPVFINGKCQLVPNAKKLCEAINPKYWDGTKCTISETQCLNFNPKPALTAGTSTTGSVTPAAGAVVNPPAAGAVVNPPAADTVINPLVVADGKTVMYEWDKDKGCSYFDPRQRACKGTWNKTDFTCTILKTQKDCDEEAEKSPTGQNLVPSEDKQSCIVKQDVDPCLELNRKKVKDRGGDEDFEIINDFQPNKSGVCVDTKKKSKSSKKADDTEDEPEVKAKPDQPFTAPPRFVPIQIPTRQMYILPGMP